MMECIRPKLGMKVGTNKHCSDAFSNCSVISFNRILVGSIAASGEYLVMEFLEQVPDERTIV